MENADSRAYRQNVITASRAAGEDIPRHLRTAGDHPVVTADRHHRLHAEQTEHDVVEPSDVQDTASAAAARHHQPEVLWHARAWVQSETITTTSSSSGGVIIANNIDDIEYPLPVGTLDTGGTEFVHQRPGEKLIAVAPQRWKDTPTIVANGHPTRRNHRGRYRIEFVTTAGDRGALAPTLLGPTPEDTRWDTSLARRDDHDVAFARITTAPRRAAILPPYRVAAAEAFSPR